LRSGGFLRRPHPQDANHGDRRERRNPARNREQPHRRRGRTRRLCWNWCGRLLAHSRGTIVGSLSARLNLRLRSLLQLSGFRTIGIEREDFVDRAQRRFETALLHRCTRAIERARDSFFTHAHRCGPGLDGGSNLVAERRDLAAGRRE
jgi:hypothetical protein